MTISRLDQIARITPQFFASADVELEKRVAQYQLNAEEHSARFDLQRAHADRVKQEKESISDPDEYERRVDKKYAELASRYSVPAADNIPPGMRNVSSQHQLRMQAHVEVKQDSENRIRGYGNEFRSGTNKILKQAEAEGRGPQQRLGQDGMQDHSQQDQTQQRDR